MAGRQGHSLFQKHSRSNLREFDRLQLKLLPLTNVAGGLPAGWAGQRRDLWQLHNPITPRAENRHRKIGDTKRRLLCHAFLTSLLKCKPQGCLVHAGKLTDPQLHSLHAAAASSRHFSLDHFHNPHRDGKLVHERQTCGEDH